jgi:uncharacterized membrane protein
MNKKILNLLTSTSLIGLIALDLSWELWLAPQRPGGSWLVLKVLPLLLPLLGVLNGRRYTHQWLSLFILLYFIEGVVRSYSDKGLSALLAGGQTALSVVLFIGAIAYVRKK